MKRLLALLGIDRRIEHIREVVNEGAMAAEDRVQLLRLAWDEQKLRLRRMAVLAFALVFLTLLMAALLSVAVIVQFWDTPHRTLVAWLVALTWVLLWGGSLAALLSFAKETTPAMAMAVQELSRDKEWLAQRFGDELQEPKIRPATTQELQSRIEHQRRRLALQERMEAVAEEAPPPETTAEKATRIVREHPMAVGAAAAVLVAVVGPKRMLKLTTTLTPILWKLR